MSKGFDHYLRIWCVLLMLPPRGRSGGRYYEVTRLSPLVAIPASLFEVLGVGILAIWKSDLLFEQMKAIPLLNQINEPICFSLTVILFHLTVGGAFLFLVWLLASGTEIN